ncbi:hypothetical protein COBT_001103 [Conglomerata obtusa]
MADKKFDLQKQAHIENTLLKINYALDNNINPNEAIKMLFTNLKYISENSIAKFIEKIQKIMFIQHNIEIVFLWSEIIKFYKSKVLFDNFFDFYWMKRGEDYETCIVKMYPTFTDYYYKYLREMEDIDAFKKIVKELKDKCAVHLSNIK